MLPEPAGPIKLPFADRAAAGRALGQVLRAQRIPRPIVFALPRGGVPVAYEVAQSLAAPLDVVLVRKLGVPGAEELAAGSVVEGGLITLNEDIVRVAGLGPKLINRLAERELAEIDRRRATYQLAPQRDVSGCAAILVDDGIATGASMRAAVEALGRRRPAQLVVAVPVGAAETVDELSRLAEVVCLETPRNFMSVGAHYRDFHQLTDAEVIALLHPPGDRPPSGEQVRRAGD